MNSKIAGRCGALAVGVLLGAVAAAFAQGLPTLWLASPSGQEQITATAYSPGAQITSIAAASLRDASGYTKAVPVTGATLTVGGSVGCNPASATAGSCVSILQMTPAGSLSTLTIKTPLYPVDGQRMEIMSTQAVSTLTMTAQSGQTINGGLTALTANVGAAWVYSASNLTWDRFR